MNFSFIFFTKLTMLVTLIYTNYTENLS